MKGLIAGISAALVTVLIVVLTVVSSTASAATGACLPESVGVVGTVPSTANLDAEQQANARTIVETVVQRRLPSRAAVIAIATAMQESGLRMLTSGDRDSVNMFQQRPSQGWGTLAQLMDPVYATNAFLDHLQDVDNWPVLPLGQAAQDVQRSADASGATYARWEDQAAAIVSGLLGRPVGDSSGADQTVSDAPGLLVLGDSLTAAFAGDWPSSYHGGAVTIDDQPSRTVAQGLTALNSLGASIPGTVLVSLGGHDAVTDGTATAFATHVRAVLAAAGTGRSVYWLTSPFAAGAAMDAALRQVALSDTHLQLVDLATTVSAHPEWLASDNALSPAGVSGVSDLVLQELGADGTGDATQTVSTQACSDGYGGYGGVPVQDCTFGLPRANPRTCQDAIRWAIAQQDGPAVWYRRCLSFVAHAYGLNYSGVGIDPATGDHSARAFWLESAFQHPGDPNPPAGALVFWDGGDGHVALSAGNGLVVSNDIRGAGTIALVPIAEINSRWNKPYLGWTPPFFPAGG